MTEESKSPWSFQGKDYVGPGQMGECPYEFTGNADEDYQEFFKAAWQFAMWASQGEVETEGDAKGIKFHPGTGVESFTFEVKMIGDNTADGITIRMGGSTYAGWAADIVGHWHELLGMLPWGYPDGELLITNQPAHDGPNKGVILHLWHD